MFRFRLFTLFLCLCLFKKRSQCEVSWWPAHHVTQPPSLHPAAFWFCTSCRETSNIFCWGRGFRPKCRPPCGVFGTPARGPSAASCSRASFPAAGTAVACQPTADIWHSQLRSPERGAAARETKLRGTAPGEKPSARGGGETSTGAGRHLRKPAEWEHAAQGPAKSTEGQDGGQRAGRRGEKRGGTEKKPHGLLIISLQGILRMTQMR